MLSVLLCLSTTHASETPRAPVVLEPGVPWTVPERERWSGRWPTATPEESGIDREKLAALSEYLFARNGDDSDRAGQRTNAFVVIRHGKLVWEQYARGTQEDTPLLTWSVTKSFGNTLYGAAVQDGLISLNDPVCKHYEPMCTPGHDDIRVTDFMRMSSGLHWVETYEASPIFSSVMGMLYTRGSDDMAAFTAARPIAHPPGTHWLYSSGDSNVLSAALKAPLGDRYDTYPWTALFEPLGMKTAVYEQDAAGTFVASSYLYASGRDLARWGQLMLDDGVWQGERLLAPGWVRYSTTIAPSFYTTPISYEHVSSNPGAQWYVNVGDVNRALDPPWPALPADAFGASGHWGKFIWVIPSWDMVVIRLGDDREYGCSYPGQPECVEDVTRAFTKTYFLEQLADAVQSHDPPEVPGGPEGEPSDTAVPTGPEQP